VGTSVPKPLSGTLSGHVAGEPFDKHVYNHLKKLFLDNTFRQFEYLNELFSKNSKVIGEEDKHYLIHQVNYFYLIENFIDFQLIKSEVFYLLDDG
tara:strand:- start:359 stop:643 length:285 start_codon:yes stop_codon:yes gene_type:complete